MARTEFFTPVRALQIAGYTHSTIQGISVDNGQLPFKSGHLEQLSKVGIESEEGSGFVKVSDTHARSFVYDFSGTRNIIWGEQYSNGTKKHKIFYTGLNSKGNNLTNPEVFVSGISPSGFAVEGMQESDSLVRAVTASQYFLSHGVPTENIVRAIEPLNLPFAGEMVSREEFKNRLKLLAIDYARKGITASPLTGRKLPSADSIPEVVEALDSMTFFITVRAMQVNERLIDFPATESATLREIFTSAFRYTNIVEKEKQSSDPQYQPQIFSVTSVEDCNRYITEYLPLQIAINLASIHKLGMIHGYPHTGNITTVGTFCDDDSVRGEPLGLGDKPITLNDVVNDMGGVLLGNSSFPPFSKIASFATANPSQEGKVQELILTTYIREMGWEGDVRFFGAVDTLWKAAKLPATEVHAYLPQIRKNLGISDTIYSDENKVTALKQLFQSNEFDLSSYAAALFNNSDASEMDQFKDELLSQDSVRAAHSLLTSEDVHGGIDKFIAIQTVAESLPIVESILSAFEKVKQFSSQSFDDYVKDKTNEWRLFQEYFKQQKVEETILDHVKEINSAFDAFHYNISSPFWSLVEQAIGWEFVLDETHDTLQQLFHKGDQVEAEKAFCEVFTKAKDENLSPEEIKKNFEEGGAWDRFTWDHRSRYYEFVVPYVEQSLEQQCKNELQELTSTLGVENVSIIKDWVIQKTCDIYVNDIPDHFSDQLELASQVRLQKLVNKLSQEEGFPPDIFSESIHATLTSDTYNKMRHDEVVVMGWEEDIILHLDQIMELFADFGEIGSNEYISYYTSLLQDQTGIGIPFSKKDTELMFSAFIDNYGQTLHQAINDALKIAPKSENKIEVVQGAYEAAGFQASTEFNWDDWTIFADRYIEDYIVANCSTVVESYIQTRSGTVEEKEKIKTECYQFLQRALQVQTEQVLVNGREYELANDINMIEEAVIMSSIAS